MEVDLTYYRRRQAEEQAATRRADNPAVRAAHGELARLYDDRITALEESARGPGLHLLDAA